MVSLRLLIAAAALLLAADPAAAYIGPGAGLTAIGAGLAVLGGLFLLAVGFIWYPVKRLARGLRGAETGDEPETQG